MTTNVFSSLCLLLLCFVTRTECSGYMEVHLQSPYTQSLSVNVSSSDILEKSEVVRDIVLHPGFPYNVTRVPVVFDERVYNVTVDCGESKEEGLHEAHITCSLTPRLGILSPGAVARPLNGIRIIIRCDPNYYGEKCDVFCDSEAARSDGKICNLNGTMACPNGFTGAKCDHKVSPSTCNCENGGKCLDTGICDCPASFRGEKCESKQRTVTLTSHYKGDFWNFKMTMWQLIFSNLVENQLAEVRPSSAWQEIQKLLGDSDETPFRNRPSDVEAVTMDGNVDLTPTDE